MPRTGPVLRRRSRTRKRDQTGLRPVPITLVPYYAWANRGPHAMRIWIPTLDRR
ncbi:hypothetical protein [Actinoallomurus acanthiterrae]